MKFVERTGRGEPRERVVLSKPRHCQDGGDMDEARQNERGNQPRPISHRLTAQPHEQASRVIAGIAFLSRVAAVALSGVS